MGRAKAEIAFYRELREAPEPMRRREFMMRIEAVIFASPQPVPRETLAALIPDDSNLDLLIADIRDELRTRPYDIVSVAGGCQHRTRPAYAAVIRGSGAVGSPRIALSPLEQLALTVIAYFQPVTRMQIGDVLGKPVSRDLIAALRSAGLVATGPHSPQPGAPHTYVTTNGFLQLSGLQSLCDLPDLDRVEEAGLLGKAPLHHELQSALGLANEAEAETEGREEADDGYVAAFEE